MPKETKLKPTPAERYGKLKLSNTDKPLTKAEQKQVFKEWEADYKLAAERDLSKRR